MSQIKYNVKCYTAAVRQLYGAEHRFCLLRYMSNVDAVPCCFRTVRQANERPNGEQGAQFQFV